MSASKKIKDQSLLIVESPTKEKTLTKFLGKGFIVKSSFGHVQDLPKGKLGIDVDKNFEPTYEILPKAKKIIPALKKAAKESAHIYLATDYDREGESIAWHLADILKLPKDKIHRITFHEITRDAIQEAIKNPRKIDQNLVDAQVARRVLDRIVGYRLSPLLWEKVRRGLSAGRVQSVAVRLICEREEEIEKFKSQEYWSIEVELENTKESKRFPFFAQLVEWKGKKFEKLEIKTEDASGTIVDRLKIAAYNVENILLKQKKRSPYPPFMTSTLAQDASNRLGFSAKRTMSIAQSLYEGVQIGEDVVGLITYMRTDSLNVAKEAQSQAQEYVIKKFGKESLPPQIRFYKTKSKSAQEAHEAIRPTSVLREPEALKTSLNIDQFKLYDLIWRRFLASQMADALYDTVTAEILAKVENDSGHLRANGSTLKEAGFLQVYGVEIESDETSEGSQDKRLPFLYLEEALKNLGVHPEQHFTEPPPRYNEASLIKTLEQNGIGRPSTYAPIIDTIQTRNYVRLETKRFYPTELGVLVNKQLVEHFPEIVDKGFTAKIEEKLDLVAEGELAWTLVVGEFYKPFQKDLEAAKGAMKKVKLVPKDSGEICPLCKGKLLLRESRFGKYLSCENFPKCHHKVSLDVQGNKVVPLEGEEKCEKCGSPMTVKMSRRGKFLACSAYPNCRTTYSLDREGKKIVRPDPKKTKLKCEKCDRMLLLRVGKRGPFLACSGFPKCRNIKSAKTLDPSDILE